MSKPFNREEVRAKVQASWDRRLGLNCGWKYYRNTFLVASEQLRIAYESGKPLLHNAPIERVRIDFKI